MLRALLEAMRPSHWVKNVFVLAPILFSRRYDSLAAWGACLGAFAAFCLLSSAVYVFNDICDRQADRAHPKKRLRPIASGRLGVPAALAGAIASLTGALLILLAVVLLAPYQHAPMPLWGLLVWSGGYLMLNLFYSAWLKQKPIVDVLCVATGFVIRAMAGANAIGVAVSPWLIICTFALCLALAVIKRRAEVIEMPETESHASRSVNRFYTRPILQNMVSVSTAMAILTYSMYCLDPRTIARVGSAHLVWTVPLVVYGLFRYDFITRRIESGDPVKVLLRDSRMWAVLGLYLALALAILILGDRGSLAGILER